MEKRLKKKIDGYMRTFKDDIRVQCNKHGISENPAYNSFLQFIYDYPPIEITRGYVETQESQKYRTST